MERFGLTCRRLCFFNSVFVCISLKTTRDNCIYRIKYFATTFSSSFDCLFFSLLSIRQFLIQFIVNFRVQFFFTFDFHLFKLMEIVCFVVIVFFFLVSVQRQVYLTPVFKCRLNFYLNV